MRPSWGPVLLSAAEAFSATSLYFSLSHLYFTSHLSTSWFLLFIASSSVLPLFPFPVLLYPPLFLSFYILLSFSPYILSFSLLFLPQRDDERHTQRLNACTFLLLLLSLQSTVAYSMHLGHYFIVVSHRNNKKDREIYWYGCFTFSLVMHSELMAVLVVK